MPALSRDPRPLRALRPRHVVADGDLVVASGDGRVRDRVRARRAPRARRWTVRRSKGRDRTSAVSSRDGPQMNCPSRCVGRRRPKPAIAPSCANRRSATPGQHQRPRRRGPGRVRARVLMGERSPVMRNPRGERRPPKGPRARRARRAPRAPRTPRGPRLRANLGRGGAQDERRVSKQRSSSSDVVANARASPSAGTRCACRCGPG